MPVLKQQQPCFIDVGRLNRRRGGLFVVFGEGDEQPILEQRLRRHVAARVRKREQHAIRAAVVEPFAGGGAGLLAQEQLEIGIIGAQPGQDARQQERCDRRDHAHPHLAGKRPSRRAREIAELFRLAQHAPRLVSDAIT